MYLIIDEEDQCHTFYHEDPRLDGYAGPIDEDVDFMFPDSLLVVPEGQPMNRVNDLCFGRSNADPRNYQVFPTQAACIASDFLPIESSYKEATTHWKPESVSKSNYK